VKVDLLSSVLGGFARGANAECGLRFGLLDFLEGGESGPALTVIFGTATVPPNPVPLFNEEEGFGFAVLLL